ncbi:hypothetical protein GH733_009008 [Mirounga leonina]|nr:hypothetical protein GH733_009008 [Mirounga leonina]
MGTGERGGFSKPGGPMDKGPDLGLGPLVDPDEDSDNSTIYMQGLNDNVTLDDLADFFKQCGVVKMKKRTRQSMIHIYLDKETGKPKGDATVSSEDPPTAKAAVEWFDGKDFQESKLKVSLARKKPLMNSMRGEGCCHHFVEVQGAQEVLGATRVAWEAVEETEVAFPQGGPRVPQGTHLEEETSSTELETGSAPVWGVETRTLPGEQNATSVRPQTMKACFHHPFHPWR